MALLPSRARATCEAAAAPLVPLVGPARSTGTGAVLTDLVLLAVAHGAAPALLPVATAGLVTPSRSGAAYGRVSTS